MSELHKFAVGKSMTTEIMTARFFQQIGYVADPDEILRRAGIRRENLRQLEGDDEISGACDTRLEAVIGTPWRLEPSEGAAAGFVREQIEPHIEHLVRGIWTAVPYGYSVVQIVFSNLGDRIGLKYVVEEEFENFIPTHTGDLLMWDGKSLDEHKIDPRRFLLTVRHPSRRNPYGQALFSRLYWPWFFRVHGWRFWSKWLERFGSPFLIGKTVGNTSEMAQALSEAVNSASIGIRDTDDITALEQTQGTGHFEAFESTIVKRFQKLILGQTLTTDMGSTGSFAAAKVHNDVREDKRNADLRLVRASVQRMINTLWALNNFGGTAPEFIMADDTGLESDRAARDAILAEKLGVEFSDSYLLDRYDLDPADFTRKEPPPSLVQQTPSSPQDKALSAQMDHDTLMQFAARGLSAQDVLDAQIKKVAGKADTPINMDDVRAAVMGAEDARDLEQRLAVLIGPENPEFRTTLERAMFSAQLLGFLSAA